MLNTDNTSSPDHQDAELVRILLRIYRILPLGYVLLMLTTFLTKDWEVLFLMPLLGFFTFLAYRQARAGRVRISVLVLLLVIIVVITILSTNGQGIHDISLVTFSCVVVLSSFILKLRGQIIVGLAILMALSWLAFGEQYAWYVPEPIKTGSYGDLVIILIILSISVIISFNLFKRLKWTLIRAGIEVRKSQETSKKLNEDLELKTELGSLVHDQVQFSLSTVRELFSLHESEAVFKISRQVRCIERLHFFSIDADVRMRDYLLDMKQAAGANWTVEVSSDYLLPLDQMLPLVIYIDEFLDTNNSFDELSITKNGQAWEVGIIGQRAILPNTMLSSIMMRQLKAEADKSEAGVTLTFKDSKGRP